jgi:hypothetical protein
VVIVITVYEPKPPVADANAEGVRPVKCSIRTGVVGWALAGAAILCVADGAAGQDFGGAWPNYSGGKPFVIAFPAGLRAHRALGGLFVHDVDGDGLMEYVVSVPGQLAVFDWDGSLLWRRPTAQRLHAGASAGENLPGSNHPGVFAIGAEIGYVTSGGELVVHDAVSGAVLRQRDGFDGAQVALAARFTSRGREVLLQYDQRAVAAVDIDDFHELWRSSEYLGFDHSPAFVADVDGDGLDEVLGPLSLAADGTPLPRPAYPEGTSLLAVDSAAFADLDGDGVVEMVLAEQGGNNATLAVRPTDGGLLWSNTERPAHPTGSCAREIDPDKLAAGDFVPSVPGIEIFVRSACGREPWVIGAGGRTLKHFRVANVVPPGWFLGPIGAGGEETEGGIDVAGALDWHGNDHANRLLVFKERAVDGDIGVLNLEPDPPALGFRLQRQALLVYAADIAGDHREEIIVLERGRILVEYHDGEPRTLRQRLWSDPFYARRKQNWNYYRTY